jgi:Fe-Mn family superoxide dismutase
MAYIAKDYSKLLGMPGFSDTLLNNHFALYQGYVKSTNTVMDALVAMAKDLKPDAPPPQYAELKRRLGWEFNGMRLHEYYFENLGGMKSLSGSSNMTNVLAAQFGSFESWEGDFRATGAMRGIGWVALYQDSATGKLFNLWINEHDTGHWAGCRPILIMDVFEHAYMLDYGTKKAGYIDAFFKNVNWAVAESRLL